MSLLAGRPNPKIPASGERDTKFSIHLIEAPELEVKGAPHSVNKYAFDQGPAFGQKCLPDDGGDPEPWYPVSLSRQTKKYNRSFRSLDDVGT